MTHRLTPQEIMAMPGNWCTDVDAWGLDPNDVQLHFGGPRLDCPTMLPPRVFEFALPQYPPSFQLTTGFWGDLIFTNMRSILRELLTERRPRDLWYFMVPEDQWYDAMVYSDSSPPQTRQALQHTDPGMWWPCLAVVDGAMFQTWCQDFALARAKKTWVADPSRCHIYARKHQATTWQQMQANSQTVWPPAPPVPAAPPAPPPPPPPAPAAPPLSSSYSSNSIPPPWPTHSEWTMLDVLEMTSEPWVVESSVQIEELPSESGDAIMLDPSEL